MSQQTQLQHLEQLMGLERRDIVTGDGVALDLTRASFMSRGVALGIDVFVTLMALSSFIAMGLNPYTNSEAAQEIFSVILMAIIAVVIPVTCEQVFRGRTLGKLLMGLRVVRTDGGAVLPLQSFVRALVALGEIWMTVGIVATLTSLSNADGKRVGDMLAGTMVITAKGPKALKPLPTAPYDLGMWAAQADVAQLPDGLALACRQYLDRAESMLPHNRQQVADYLVSAVSSHVSPPPPRTTYPEEYLIAVVNERTRRDIEANARHRAKRLAQRREIDHVAFSLQP